MVLSMSSIQNFWLFFALSWVLIITPGPDLIYVVTRGISQGKTAGVISAVGVTLGILVHTLFAALGLSIILKTSAIAFVVVKTVGAIYLIYLGIKSLVTRHDIDLAQVRRLSQRKLFAQGLITNTLNPKVALFFMAFLPQFIASEAAASPIPFVLLGLSFAMSGFIFLVVLGYFSGRVGGFIQQNKNASWIVQKLSGVVMLLLGVKLAFSRNN